MHDTLQLGETRTVSLDTDQMWRVHLVAEAAHRERTHPAIVTAAQMVREALGDDATDELGRAAASLALVQSMGRLPDPPAADIVAGPIATLREGRGDCLTLSGVLASIMLALGLDVRFARITQPCDPDDHVCIAVRVDGQWLWADPVSVLPLGQAAHGLSVCPLPPIAEIV